MYIIQTFFSRVCDASVFLPFISDKSIAEHGFSCIYYSKYQFFVSSLPRSPQKKNKLRKKIELWNVSKSLRQKITCVKNTTSHLVCGDQWAMGKCGYCKLIVLRYATSNVVIEADGNWPKTDGSVDVIPKQSCCISTTNMHVDSGNFFNRNQLISNHAHAHTMFTCYIYPREYSPNCFALSFMSCGI